jgi:DNA-binding transcriptional regulator YhcF (GntR family)
MPDATPPLVVDPDASMPPYEQIRTQIVSLIDSGELAAGARLPTVRQLAVDLAVAPNTVARSYRTLESDGVVETRGRHGTFVAHDGDATRRAAIAEAEAYAARIRRLGLAPAEGVRLAADALGVPHRSPRQVPPNT